MMVGLSLYRPSGISDSLRVYRVPPIDRLYYSPSPLSWPWQDAIQFGEVLIFTLTPLIPLGGNFFIRKPEQGQGLIPLSAITRHLRQMGEPGVTPALASESYDRSQRSLKLDAVSESRCQMKNITIHSSGSGKPRRVGYGGMTRRRQNRAPVGRST
jgi:hypothetical protein